MGYNVGILGATGVVGREMIKVLSERNFPIASLYLFASERSAGSEIDFKGEKIKVKTAESGDFEELDIVFGAVNADIAKEKAPEIVKSGAVFIDNSSAFRLDGNVPLVVPGINPDDVKKHAGIISNPNCSTIIALTAINPINKLSEVKSVIASTYQAVSGAGKGGIDALRAEEKAIYENTNVTSDVFGYPIAENAIAKIGSFQGDGYTSEEVKMQNEGRKILHIPDLTVTCTCVRVPVLRCHSISLSVFTKDKISVKAAKEAIKNERGCVLDDLPAFPMPAFSSGDDSVHVGRIRDDFAFPNGIAMFCCGDQLRKGAATNAVEIAELL
ncbi:MAG: aspartate-semialdehyde dehydrogenase, partial [Clostridiales bacterium]|nr:aspartate-semialdehyde dehydrogenase [Clostridiales bacterium]